MSNESGYEDLHCLDSNFGARNTPAMPDGVTFSYQLPSDGYKGVPIYNLVRIKYRCL